MKKLIVPLLIGFAVFGAAFGGAFFLYRHQQAEADEHVKNVIAETLGRLRRDGRLSILAGRFVTIVASAPHEKSSSLLIVPGTVRYEIDLATIRDADVVLKEDEELLSVKMPPVAIAGPEIDTAGIMRYDESGALFPASAGNSLDTGKRNRALAALLKQARAKAMMDLVHKTLTVAMKRTFMPPLHDSGVKANIEVQFADAGDTGRAGETILAPPPLSDAAMETTGPVDRNQGGETATQKE